MGAVVPYKVRMAKVKDLLTKNMPHIRKGLPASLESRRLEAIVLTEIRDNLPLLECDAMSLVGAIAKAAQIGLVPGLLGQAYLVPFKDRAQLIIGYRGYVELARRSGAISKIEAHLVYKNEVDTSRFKRVLGTAPSIFHDPIDDGDTGPITHVYAVAFFKDGTTQFDVMTIEEIEAIRASSKMGSSGPWKDYFGEMAKKTVIRRLFKLLPLGAEVDVATKLDDQIDSGAVQDFSDAIDVEATQVDVPDKTLIQKATEKLHSNQIDVDEAAAIRQREIQEAARDRRLTR